MQRVQIDFDDLQGTVEQIDELSETSADTFHRANASVINGSYSAVSGLDQLGASHGGVVNGGSGSAMMVLREFKEQVAWLGEALTATAAALSGQEEYARRALEIGDTGGSVGTNVVAFPSRPDAKYASFDFLPPLAMRAASLAEFSGELVATNDAAVLAAAAKWAELGTKVTGISVALRAMASQLAMTNQGDVVDKAVEKINDVASQGERFAINAGLMGTSVGQLLGIKAEYAAKAAAATAEVTAVKAVDPVSAQALEQTLLSTLHAGISTAVQRGVPVIRNLMTVDAPNSGGGGSALTGMNTVAGNGKLGTTGYGATGPTVNVASVSDATGSGTGTGDFATANSAVQELGAVDSSEVAARAANTASNSSTLAGDSSPIPKSNLLGSTASVTPASASSPLSSTVGQVGTSGMIGRTNSNAQSSGSNNIAGNPSSLSSLGKGGGAGSAGMRQGAGSLARAGISGNSGVGAAAMRGNSLAGGIGNGTAGHGRAPMMGGMPMGGNQQQSKGSKRVKAITTEIESDQNVRSLVGNRKKIVPGVIGAWVRE